MKKWTTIIMSDNDKPIDVFFWLGDEAKPEPLTEEEFEERIEATAAAERKWRNVELNG